MFAAGMNWAGPGWAGGRDGMCGRQVQSSAGAAVEDGRSGLEVEDEVEVKAVGSKQNRTQPRWQAGGV